MQNIILTGAGAALIGLLLGWLAGAWRAGKKHREQAEIVRGEVIRLRALAEEKLSGDDPDLDQLLGNLKSAAVGAYDALQAMENQAKLTKRKSEGSREVIASSLRIIRMIDEQTGHEAEPIDVTPKPKAPRLTAKKPS